MRPFGPVSWQRKAGPTGRSLLSGLRVWQAGFISASRLELSIASLACFIRWWTSVALNKFLESKIDDYSYENNFGGVYYLFVRGMQVGSNSGIFYDLPSVETIRTLDTFLSQQND